MDVKHYSGFIVTVRRIKYIIMLKVFNLTRNPKEEKSHFCALNEDSIPKIFVYSNTRYLVERIITTVENKNKIRDNENNIYFILEVLKRLD